MNEPATRRRRHWTFWPLVGMAAVFVIAFLLAGWILGSSGGASLALSAAGLEATGLEGRLAGPLRAQRIVFNRPQIRVVAENVAFDWAPLGLFGKKFHVTDLVADSISIATAPSNEPAKLPLTLEPPLTIVVDKAQVKRVRFGTLPKTEKGVDPFSVNWTPDFEALDINLQSVAGGEAWVIEKLGATTKIGRVDVKGRVGARKPFILDITAELAGERDGKRYRITGTAKGELAKFETVVRGTEGGVTGDAHVAIEPFEAQPVRRIVGKLEGIDINAFAPSAPRTRMSVQADIAATRDNALEGAAQFVNSDTGPIDKERLPIAQVKGRLRIAPPRYDVLGASVAFAGGGSASGDIRIDGAQAEVTLNVEGVDLAAWHGKLKPTKLAGVVEAHASADVQRFAVSLKDPRFELAGKAAIAKRKLTVEEARIARGPAIARLAGTMDLDGNRAFDFAGTLEHLDPSAFANAPQGEINARLRAKGAFSPTLVGELNVEGLDGRFAGLAVAGHATVTGEERRIAKADVSMTLGSATIDAKGSFGRAGDSMDVKVAATDLAPIGKALAIEVAGAVDIDAKLTGTYAAPGGAARVKGEHLRVPGGVGFESLAIRMEVAGDPAGKVEGAIDATNVTHATKLGSDLVVKMINATIGGTRAQHRLILDATLPADLAPLASPTDAPREPRFSIVLAGGLAEKAAKPTWNGTIESASMTGHNAMRLAAPATLTLARDHIEIGDAQFKGDLGDARFAVTRWSPQAIEVRGSSEGLLTRPIVRALGLAMSPRSNIVLAVQWDLKAGDTVDGFVRVKRVSGDLRVGEPPVALGMETLDASVEATRGNVKAVLALRGTQVGHIDAIANTVVRKEGGEWTFPKNSPLSGNVEADVPTLKWAADWLGPEAKLEGKLQGKLAIGGTLGTPSYTGRVAADGIEVQNTTFGFDVDQGSAAFAFDQKTVRIEKFELASAWRPTDAAKKRFGGEVAVTKGTITAEGSLDLADRSGAIVVRAASYPVSQLATRFIAGSGEARIAANERDITITGTFKADAGWLGIADSAPPSLSDDVLVDRGGDAPVPASDKQRLSLDFRLGLGDHLYFAGRGLFTRLAGDLRLRGEPGRSLAATGSIRTEGGTYDAYGQKLAIERGVLSFQGTLENPGLNVLAVRAQDLPVTAGVEILGNVSRPDVRLYSRPDVPDHEKLSWLILGRGPADASEKDTATLAAAAGALLGATSNRRVLRSFGVDDFGISRQNTGVLGALPQSTVAGRTSATSGTDVFTVGKRLTQDIYVSYQQGLADAQASLRFTYQVSQKLQFLLRAGDRPGVDAIYHFTFGKDEKKK
jgi:translocation and assembly module TamB